MLLKNVASQGVYLYAYTISTGVAKTGDSANITGYSSIDGATTGTVFGTANPTEIGAANMPGVYWQPLAQSETNGNAIAYSWKSATAGIAIDPLMVLTTGVSVPVVAPGAAGGTFIAGTNAATTVTTSFTTTFTGNLTGSVGSVTGAVGSVTGAVGSVTAAVTLPSIPSNWITAAGITASALNGKGDWLLSSSYTTPPTVAAIATGVWQDSTAGDFTTASSIGKSLYNAFTANTSVFTTASLVNAPTGGSAPTAAQVATAVWQDATAGDFTVASSIGKALYIANVVPGAAGGHFIAGTNAATVITGSLSTTFSGNLSGSVSSVLGNVAGNVTGSVASVVGAVTLDKTQTLSAARALDAVADTSLTINDALHCAIAAATGKETVIGTSYAIKTPSTGTVIRTFTLDSPTSPTSRT